MISWPAAMSRNVPRSRTASMTGWGTLASRDVVCRAPMPRSLPSFSMTLAREAAGAFAPSGLPGGAGACAKCSMTCRTCSSPLVGLRTHSRMACRPASRVVDTNASPTAFQGVGERDPAALGLGLVAARPFPAEAHDSQRRWCHQRQRAVVPDQFFGVGGQFHVAVNGSAERGHAEGLYGHPDFERVEATGQLDRKSV